MKNELAKLTPSETEFNVMRQQAHDLVKTGFLPQSIKTPEQALAIILTGRELGIPAMAALNTINVISGKPTVSPQLMLALIERSGQLEDIVFEQNPSSVSVTMRRRYRTPHTEVFGEQSAKAMGLLTKDNYRKQPLVMYKWRAVAACARVVFPDVILGLYTPEEMGATVEVDDEGKMTVIDTGEPHDKKKLDAERKAILDSLGRILREMNDEGIEPKWTKTTVNEYIAQQYKTDNGVDGLFIDELERLHAEMEATLRLMREEDYDAALLAEIDGMLTEDEVVPEEIRIEMEKI